MSGLEIAAIITAIGGAIVGIGTLIVTIVRLIAESKDSQERIKKLETQHIEDQRLHEQDRRDIERNRTDLIMIGEAWSDTKYDTATMALLINQLFNQYKAATGKAPDVDIDMLRHMRTIGYITGPLGPLNVDELGPRR